MPMHGFHARFSHWTGPLGPERNLSLKATTLTECPQWFAGAPKEQRESRPKGPSRHLWSS